MRGISLVAAGILSAGLTGQPALAADQGWASCAQTGDADRSIAGCTYQAKGDYERAIADYTEAIRTDPNPVGALVNRGMAHEQTGELELARRDFAAALADPRSKAGVESVVETARTRLALLGAPQADLPVQPRSGGRRLALVLGNDRYTVLPPLRNAVADARAVAQALRALQFHVYEGADLDFRGTNRLYALFESALAPGDTAFVFFAGHGIAIGAENYLLPTDMERPGEAQGNLVRSEAHSLDDLIRRVKARGARASLFVIDACRDNPFGTAGVRGVGSTRGLTRVDTPTGVFVLFAAGTGQSALDKLNDADPSTHSVFTRTLIPLLGQPGLTHLALAKRVQTEVKALASRVHHAQHPAFYDQIDGEIVLKPATGGGPPGQSSAQLETIISPNPRLTKADVIRIFSPVGAAYEKVRSHYVEEPDNRKVIRAAIAALQQAASPPHGSTPGGEPSASSAKFRDGSLDDFYDAAVAILGNAGATGDVGRIVDAAVKGMIGSLDPHSKYLSTQELDRLHGKYKGEIGGGLGIEARTENGLIKVVRPIQDTPAARSGIQPGDIITHLDGQTTQGMALQEAIEAMRGPVGTKIRVTIARDGVDRPLDVLLVRERIKVRSVTYRREGDDIGYIRISQFTTQTAEELKRGLTDLVVELTSDKVKGYVLDLRNNTGGPVDPAISVAGALLEENSVIMSKRPRQGGQTSQLRAKGGDLARGRPIVVLINGGSAAASEIVVGALQDHRRATVIGTRSFGWGSLQTVFPLGPGKGALQLTTDRYLTPAGRSIQAMGIVPDIEILQDVPSDHQGTLNMSGEAALPGHLSGEGKEVMSSQSYVPLSQHDDKALNLAFELLRQGRKSAKSELRRGGTR